MASFKAIAASFLNDWKSFYHETLRYAARLFHIEAFLVLK